MLSVPVSKGAEDNFKLTSAVPPDSEEVLSMTESSKLEF